jgi:hypothetical protein
MSIICLRSAGKSQSVTIRGIYAMMSCSPACRFVLSLSLSRYQRSVLAFKIACAFASVAALAIKNFYLKNRYKYTKTCLFPSSFSTK